MSQGPEGPVFSWRWIDSQLHVKALVPGGEGSKYLGWLLRSSLWRFSRHEGHSGQTRTVDGWKFICT
ncbi:hypothetical protein CHARACLAT_008807 [Characodon lateralis]|uniref:Uncharacterized protein n=1 Tax=Characodon lateralis TaxID=208331 RepID=A0ABU7DR50_9TELE|nr:hypothetical protein [Characodon lateralis]